MLALNVVSMLFFNFVLNRSLSPSPSHFAPYSGSSRKSRLIFTVNVSMQLVELKLNCSSDMAPNMSALLIGAFEYERYNDFSHISDKISLLVHFPSQGL